MLAGRVRERTGDYLSALSYIQTARALGNAGPVSDFMLDIEEAGCEFALGHLERTRALCDAILGSPGGLTEKALAANLLAEVYMRSRRSAWRWRRRYVGWACSGSRSAATRKCRM